MNESEDIDLIFINDCEQCGIECNERKWYNKEVYLCEDCFINILSDEKCAGNSRHLCKNIECKKCYLKSFASNEKSIYWSEKNNLTPRQVFKSSNKIIIFDCECCHEFELSPHYINDGQWCSYCSNPPKKMCNNRECKTCFNKSFVSHENSKYWSENNNLTPRDVFLNSHKIFSFDCQCGHEIYLSCLSVNSDRWCIYCGHQKLCDNDNCSMCFNNSFASHEKSKYWSEKNRLIPRNIFKSSSDCGLFKCKNNHEFQSLIRSVTRMNSWCPICKNKTEKILLEFLQTIYKSTIHQYRIDWCRSKDTNRYLPFDFYIPELKIIIELDGQQHFEYVKMFNNNVDDNQNRDVYKTDLALKNCISVIRIVQQDVWDDKIDWKNLLITEIEKLKTVKEPTICYIAKDSDIYNDHMIKSS